MKKKHVLPSISIAIATHNSTRTLSRCLQSIRDQDYPQNRIEIIIADGASRDDTRDTAIVFGAKVTAIPSSRQNAEYNKSMAIKHAKNEILAMIDHDNVLPHPGWLTRMVQPFMDSKEIVGVETLRYHYDPATTPIDRYFALFGAADPLVWYMKKTDRLSYIFDSYNLAGHARDVGDYYIVRFSEKNIPTIGANGFLVRRATLMKHAKAAPGQYFDMDVNVDLIRKGFSTYAFVKDSILHLTGYGTVWSFLGRRLLFLTQYRFNEARGTARSVRRYGSVSGRDLFRLVWAIIVCATVVIPLYDAIRGWRKIHDTAWFLHPLLCVSFVVIYSWAIIRGLTLSYAKRILGR